MTRRALLIGTKTYVDARLHALSKSDQDVVGLEAVLADPRIGAFDEVRTMLDPDWHEAQPAITSFFRKSGPDDVLLLFFAGHGVKDSRGDLFFAFSDTELDDLDGTAIASQLVARQMDRSKAESQILILDCCYAGAFGRDARGVIGGSSGAIAGYSEALEGSVGVGRVVLTASDAVQYAWEGAEVLGSAPNSVFTGALIDGLASGDADLDNNGIVTADELFDYCRSAVRRRDDRQVPQFLSRPGPRHGAVCIALNPRLHLADKEPPVSISKGVSSAEAVRRHASLIEVADLLSGPPYDVAARRILANSAVRDPDRSIRFLAWKLINGKGDATRGSLLTTPFAYRKDVRDVLPEPFDWCNIAAGFVSIAGSRDPFSVDEFDMAKYPITGEQFEVFVAASDGYMNDEWWRGFPGRRGLPAAQLGDDPWLPRVNVNWFEAVAFCRWLSAKTASLIRLPTEWEWQWAASNRDGGRYPWGDVFDRRRCNTVEGLVGHSTVVDAYQHNISQFGVVDAIGNVWERCLNEYSPPYRADLGTRRDRVVRGGSWRYSADKAELTHRHVCLPQRRFNDGGFRIAMFKRPA